MNGLAGLEVVVAGAGAWGLASALELAAAGARVSLVDPGDPAPSASAVAAGMLAPAFEALFDGRSAPPLGLMRRARDLWPALADSLGVDLDQRGALAVGSEAETSRWLATLERAGVDAERLSPAAARGWAPDLADGLFGVFARGEWRLEPAAALRALRSAAAKRGARLVDGRVLAFEAGRVLLAGGGTIAADRLVIATGASRDLAGLAPELASLQPIKGHIVVAKRRLAGPVVRFEDGYICPSAEGAVIGATMEPGRADVAIEAAQVRTLMERAIGVMPALAGARVRARAGVRSATPDGLPLAGPAAAGGVWLAVGARRNGWLLAPLVAAQLRRGLEGADPDRTSQAFAPARLSAA